MLNMIKLWSTDINKIYLWPTEIKKAYLGSTLIYDKTATPNWLLNNLVSYYKMDTNWSFLDAHWSNDWTISGATYTASGKINWWYDFDWVNDCIEATIDIWSTTNFSVMQWINADDLSIFAQRTFARWSFWNDLAIQVFQSKIRAIIWQDWWWVSISWQTWTISTNTWYNLLITYDGINLKIYLNGALSVNTAFSTSIASWPVLSSIWCDTNEDKEYFDGTIDETWFWSRVLSQTDVDTLYNSWAWLSYDNFTT